MKTGTFKSVMVVTAVTCVAVGFSLSRSRAEDGPPPTLQPGQQAQQIQVQPKQQHYRMTVEYSVDGVPEEIQSFTMEEWQSYRDSLPVKEAEALAAQMVITTQVEFRGLTVITTSDGQISLFNADGAANGEFQLSDEGFASVLQDANHDSMGFFAWPGNRNTDDDVMSVRTFSEEGGVVALNGRWLTENETGNIWFGSRTFDVTVSNTNASITGSDLQLGEPTGRWSPLGWIGGVVEAVGGATVAVGVVAATATAYAAYCASLGLFGAYDCTPGTQACRCNGCTSC